MAASLPSNDVAVRSDVAVDQTPPAHFHGLGEAQVNSERSEVAPRESVRLAQGNAELRRRRTRMVVVDGSVTGSRLSGKTPWKPCTRGSSGDLVGFHGVQADARQTAVES